MRIFALVTLTTLLSAGCSTRPREFRPTLAGPAADETKFDETLLQCQVMVRRGVKGNFATTAAQLGGGTAGSFLGAVVASSVVSSTAGAFPGTAIAVGGSAFLIAGPLTGFGVSRLIRTSREKKYKAALGSCLTEFGYAAQNWEKQKKLSKDQVNAVVEKWKTAAGTSEMPKPSETPGT